MPNESISIGLSIIGGDTNSIVFSAILIA